MRDFLLLFEALPVVAVDAEVDVSEALPVGEDTEWTPREDGFDLGQGAARFELRQVAAEESAVFAAADAFAAEAHGAGLVFARVSRVAGLHPHGREGGTDRGYTLSVMWSRRRGEFPRSVFVTQEDAQRRYPHALWPQTDWVPSVLARD